MKIDKDYLKSKIKDVPDYPSPGIIFKDITPLFLEPEIINFVIDEFAKHVASLDVDAIVGVESRGYLFGLPLALKINKPFVMARKPNKLPREVYSADYSLEYGKSTMQMHKDALEKGMKVLIVDDLLATGGTVGAVEDLVRQAGGIVVGSLFLIKLNFLEGDKKLSGNIYSLINY
ncbi:adenine phosphoribosyltransferase [Ureaplasma canigenitalium]|uniref:adenine phosphoribosyltransferase n=1 Tax=Ureaplasma canigenitalium TaxID=42092 RepID=UPI0004E20B64|nr:adenine phosphoribosyltransferase [Ureaplasma canigenitalium]